MAEKPPAFQWYPRDFLTDEKVVVMPNSYCGAYVRLMCHEWLEGSLPDDPAMLARLACEPAAAFAPMWELFGSKFTAHPTLYGRLIHPRLQKEREKQAEWRAKSSKGGKASAEARRRPGGKGG